MADVKAETDPPSLSSCARSEAQRIREIREREQAATEGPWSKNDVELALLAHCHQHRGDRRESFWAGNTKADAAFIAMARQDIPWLLQRSEEAAEKQAELLRDWREQDRVLQAIAAEVYDEHISGPADVLREVKAALAEKESALAAARQEVTARTEFMEMEGYRRCDIPACNCNRWHGGNSARRLGEIRDALHDAGIDTNGRTTLSIVADLAAARLRATPQEQE